MSKHTLKEALLKSSQSLKPYSTSPHLDAELLLSHCTGKNKAQLIAYSDELIKEKQYVLLNTLIERRINGEPIAYILGHKEFWDLDLTVNQHTLIPRPETEHCVEWILENLPDTSQTIADLGLGTGAIALALAHERPQWMLHGTELSKEAFITAKKNAKQHKIKNSKFFHGSWFEPLPLKDYNCIVSNPPYIANNDKHLEELAFEPISALASGADGLDAIRTIITEAPQYLKSGGFLVLEHGYDQHNAIMELFNNTSFEKVVDHEDLAGQPRFITAKLG